MKEYSDYDLYKLLDGNGFEPSEDNLAALKEGLGSGYFSILRMPESAFVSEGTSDNYNYCQILEENGYAMTASNVESLEEAEELGRVLYEGKLWNRIKEKHHERVVKRHRKKQSKQMKKAWKEGNTPLQIALRKKAAEQAAQSSAANVDELVSDIKEEHKEKAAGAAAKEA
jgi:hypothetical protein